MFNIEKNIPIPTENKGSASRFPFDDMEIGDSFVAATDPKLFGDIVQEMEERNKAGDGRLFVSLESSDMMASMLRIWRVSPRKYLDLNPNDKLIIDWLVNIVEEEPLISRTALLYRDLRNGPGSKAARYKILDKYAFLFKITDASTGGKNYTIA
tara:strand:- start:146 stop:607 length:462 start_codon:yes stop_codon:yes gene_type:complete